MSTGRILTIVIVLLHVAAISPKKSFGQAFGVELGASMMPASGGMGGASVARPQDVQSALMNNPATLTQFKGTHFSFGGGWAEPTINIDNDATLPLANITPYQAKSQRPGSIVGNIAATQDFEALGLPVTTGIGLLTSSGLGVDYRRELESNGTSAEFVVLGTGVGAGVELTDRLSIGAVGAVSTATMDGIFAGVSSEVPDYNLRGTLGLSYHIRRCTTVGAFWKTEEKHTFDNFFRPAVANTPFQDVKVSLPEHFGIGVADQSLMGGRLLLALDLLYYRWSETDLFGALWEDQFALQTGMQYTTRRGINLRMGYAFAENASRDIVLSDIGGVINPTPAANYIQALFPNINRNRISFGVGVKDILPGVDLDLFAGGMFEETQSFGLTSASVESYWIGFGTTWRFRRGSCGKLRIADQW
jgi:long-chain fatty acid transport protein